MTMINIGTEFLVGGLSAIGFGLVTNVPRRMLIPAGITGAVSWFGYYLISQQFSHLIIWPNLLATIIIGFLGSYFARLLSGPATMIYIPSLVSLVPGGLAAIGLQNLTTGNSTQATQQLLTVLLTAVSLAVGFIIGEAIFQVCLSLQTKWVTYFKHDDP